MDCIVPSGIQFFGGSLVVVAISEIWLPWSRLGNHGLQAPKAEPLISGHPEPQPSHHQAQPPTTPNLSLPPNPQPPPPTSLPNLPTPPAFPPTPTNPTPNPNLLWPKETHHRGGPGLHAHGEGSAGPARGARRGLLRGADPPRGGDLDRSTSLLRSRGPRTAPFFRWFFKGKPRRHSPFWRVSPQEPTTSNVFLFEFHPNGRRRSLLE